MSSSWGRNIEMLLNQNVKYDYTKVTHIFLLDLTVVSYVIILLLNGRLSWIRVELHIRKKLFKN